MIGVIYGSFSTERLSNKLSQIVYLVKNLEPTLRVEISLHADLFFLAVSYFCFRPLNISPFILDLMGRRSRRHAIGLRLAVTSLT